MRVRGAAWRAAVPPHPAAQRGCVPPCLPGYQWSIRTTIFLLLLFFAGLSALVMRADRRPSLTSPRTHICVFQQDLRTWFLVSFSMSLYESLSLARVLCNQTKRAEKRWKNMYINEKNKATETKLLMETNEKKWKQMRRKGRQVFFLDGRPSIYVRNKI